MVSGIVQAYDNALLSVPCGTCAWENRTKQFICKTGPSIAKYMRHKVQRLMLDFFIFFVFYSWCNFILLINFSQVLYEIITSRNAEGDEITLSMPIYKLGFQITNSVITLLSILSYSFFFKLCIYISKCYFIILLYKQIRKQSTLDEWKTCHVLCSSSNVHSNAAGLVVFHIIM